MPTAIVTGASQGFGLALTRALADAGWSVVVDARDGDRLAAATRGVPHVRAIAGDVTDAAHRRALVDAAAGSLDLLVLNASALGPTPLPPLADVPLEDLSSVLATNVVASLGLVQLALPMLRAGNNPVIVALSSDAAVEAYPGWGTYGASKAALDHLCQVLAAEEPHVRIYAFDPGDMNTDMATRALPDDDMAERADPADVVPALLSLLTTKPAGVRHTAAEFLAVVRR